MNLTNLARVQLSKTAGINTALDGIADRANLWARVEHNDNGHHTAITADSLSLTQDAVTEATGDLVIDGGTLAITSDSASASRVDVSIENTAPTSQTRVRLVDEGGGYAELALFNSGAPTDSGPQAPNMFRIRHGGTASGALVIQNTWNSGGILLYGGSALMFKVDDTAIYERGRSVGIGDWATISYVAGNFSGEITGTADWTVDNADVVSLRYTRVGNTVTLNYSIQNTDVANSPTQLRFVVPLAVVASGRFTSACSRALDNGTVVAARAVIDAGISTTSVAILKADSAVWTNTAGDNTTVEGQLVYEAA